MRTCPACRAANFIARQANEATRTSTRVLFRTVAEFFAVLCLICPISVRAEEATQCQPELNRNPLVVVARIVKLIGPPPCKILSLLSGGRFDMVLPPKVMVNKLMDTVIVLASDSR
jgi:hypothetical protein